MLLLGRDGRRPSTCVCHTSVRYFLLRAFDWCVCDASYCQACLTSGPHTHVQHLPLCPSRAQSRHLQCQDQTNPTGNCHLVFLQERMTLSHSKLGGTLNQSINSDGVSFVNRAPHQDFWGRIGVRNSKHCLRLEFGSQELP